MNYKHIEASREIRLWITQVIVPLVGTGGFIIATVPEARETIKTKWNDRKARKKFTSI